ncbi:hypothetical protein NECAME_11345 [Necator americanus]|uniref:Uncharacterized protein n=1 Tax=Necator americanus TaxID=51031 RepID=W2T5X5_NECAM|nr:hypothetical protein NECAME_11345 [Necator americanus]ETN77024.1 hypothetical protein NECAME_11345 [Necator americanus]
MIPSAVIPERCMKHCIFPLNDVGSSLLLSFMHDKENSIVMRRDRHRHYAITYDSCDQPLDNQNFTILLCTTNHISIICCFYWIIPDHVYFPQLQYTSKTHDNEQKNYHNNPNDHKIH